MNQNRPMNDKNNPIGNGQALGLITASTYEEAMRNLVSGGIADRLASMQSVLKPLEGMREQLDALVNPYREIQAAIAASDPSRGIREAAAKLGGIDAIFQGVTGANMSSALEDMRRYTGITNFKELFTATDSHFRSRPKLFDQYLSINATTAKHLEELIGRRTYMDAAEQNAEWISSSKAMQASLERLMNPLGVASAQAYWESMVKASERYGAEGGLEESQLLGAEGMGEEIGQLVHGVAEGISKALTPQEAVDQIVQGFKAAQEPQHRWILVGIFWPILLLLLSPIWNSYVDFHMKKSLEGASTQSANKQVKEAAREAVGDLRLLHDYRFVTAQSLTVSSEPQARGQALGQLRLGQTVHVIGKERDFTLVTWRSEDGNAQLQGWVFSRYLKRFQ